MLGFDLDDTRAVPRDISQHPDRLVVKRNLHLLRHRRPFRQQRRRALFEFLKCIGTQVSLNGDRRSSQQSDQNVLNPDRLAAML